MGCMYRVFVNSGSSVNLLIICAATELYIRNPGDEMIVPALTY
jgi:dTDP-4-amino-4,6-dideoxygalactose transaminase